MVQAIKKALIFLNSQITVNMVRYTLAQITAEDKHPPSNVFHAIWTRAIEQSADYIEPQLSQALLFNRKQRLWDHALNHISIDGLHLEFGVYRGKSINYFAKRIKSSIYGFDSFDGLKEAWPGSGAGEHGFSTKGVMPSVAKNVTLVPGWFDETLPGFLHEHSGPAAFIHIDCDTYESTKLVLDALKDRIVSGTVIIFDEYHGVPNWQNGEFKAWQAHCKTYDVRYRYLGFANMQTAVEVL